MAEPAIKKLGTFLADLTQDKPPDQIHQEILQRLRDPDQDLDHRLAGIYLHVKDFVPIWTAIRNGVSLPASSWETVVLPVVEARAEPAGEVPEKIDLAGLRRLQAAGEPVVLLDVRTSRSLEISGQIAPGTIRLDPERAAFEAERLHLPREAWLVAFCA